MMKTYLASCKAIVKLVTKYETAEMLLIANFLHYKAINYQKEKHYSSQTYPGDQSRCEIQVSLTWSDDEQFALIML